MDAAPRNRSTDLPTRPSATDAVMASATSNATFFSRSFFLSSSMTGSTWSRRSVCVPATLAMRPPTFRENQPRGAPSSSGSSTTNSSSVWSQAAASPAAGMYVPRISSRRRASAAAAASEPPCAPDRSSSAAAFAEIFLFRWLPSRQTVAFLPPFFSSSSPPPLPGFFLPRRRPPDDPAPAVRRLSFARGSSSAPPSPPSPSPASSSASSSALSSNSVPASATSNTRVPFSSKTRASTVPPAMESNSDTAEMSTSSEGALPPTQIVTSRGAVASAKPSTDVSPGGASAATALPCLTLTWKRLQRFRRANNGFSPNRSTHARAVTASCGGCAWSSFTRTSTRTTPA
mmetsp:Transcript_32312/g.97120  ORF Transcript_32312/g.97120 Transcript_32312/m.97120 type:complete len:345 (-) Transcript_32312:2120-3154(-)